MKRHISLLGLLYSTLMICAVPLTHSACGIMQNRQVYGPAMSAEKAKRMYQTTSVSPTYTWIKKNALRICPYCHADNDKVSFLSYKDTVPVVVPGDPEKSRLYQYVASGRMPKGAPKLSDEKIQAIYDWIKNGAKEN